MFTFVRTFRGVDVETFEILLAGNAARGSAKRFGKAVDMYGVQTEHHQIGKLVLIHKTENGKKKVEQLICWREGLTEEERDALLFDLQMLVGGSTDSDGGFEPKHHVAGRFASDTTSAR